MSYMGEEGGSASFLYAAEVWLRLPAMIDGTAIGNCGPRDEAAGASRVACNCLFEMAARYLYYPVAALVSTMLLHYYAVALSHAAMRVRAPSSSLVG